MAGQWSEDEKLMQLAGHLRGKAARVLSPQLYGHFEPNWTQAAVHWQLKSLGMHYNVTKKVCQTT